MSSGTLELRQRNRQHREAWLRNCEALRDIPALRRRLLRTRVHAIQIAPLLHNGKKPRNA